MPKPHYGYLMALVHEILESEQVAQYFSSLELQSGYWQVAMDEESKQKTAIDHPSRPTPDSSQPLQDLEAVFQKLHQGGGEICLARQNIKAGWPSIGLVSPPLKIRGSVT
ncbi:unnamed protein product [Pleuronectes platessa]|uniref:Uncharacterized protein n=1 Tax=Pleuronectes platessa TaxID=8262 RepID=A0A9N7V3S5_PLEPL|nr:unnamed protein product [Pleuronectes platessa]